MELQQLMDRKLEISVTRVNNLKKVISLAERMQNEMKLTDEEKRVISLCIVGPAKRNLNIQNTRVQFWSDEDSVKEWMGSNK